MIGQAWDLRNVMGLSPLLMGVVRGLREQVKYSAEP